MIEYLEKFKNLDQKLRDAVSNQEAVAKITALEKDFAVNLSELVIKVMVKDIALQAVPGFLVSELKMDLGRADELFQKLKTEVFGGVVDYLQGSSQGQDAKAQNQKIITLEKPQAGTQFIFDAEDEEEIAAHRGKLEAKAEAGPDWNEAAAKIISLAKLSFGSDVLNERVKNILTTYLKGVRNKVDTKLFLQKSIAEGGVAIEESLADQIIVLAQEFVIKPELAPARPKIAVLEDQLAGRDMPYDFAKEMERRQQEKSKGADAKPVANLVDPYSFGRPKEMIGKVVMNDVKVAPPKIMNQLDELRFIDLVIFRRLSNNPEEATKRIKEKIELLEFENYHRRLEGIKAWRQSPINKIYLKICELAVADNAGVGQVIADLQAKNEPCLSPAEFVAIMKLNKELRY
jgi:hypothetical protein